MNVRTWLAGLALFAVAAVGAAQDWGGDGAVALRVLDERKRAVPDVRVTLLYVDVEPYSGPPPLTTDADGEAGFRGLTEGRWRIDLDHPDYAHMLALIFVRSGKLPEVTAGPLRDGAEPALSFRFIKYDQRMFRPPPPPAGAPSPVERSAERPVDRPVPPDEPQAATPSATPPRPEPSPPEPSMPSAPEPAAPPPEEEAPPSAPAAEPSGPSPEPRDGAPTAAAAPPAEPAKEDEPPTEEPSGGQTPTTEPAAAPPVPEEPPTELPPAEIAPPPTAPAEPAPSTTAQEPSPPAPEPATAEPPAALPPAPEPATAEPQPTPEPAPSRPPRLQVLSSLRSASAGNCSDCRPGEQALTAEVLVGTGPGGSPVGTECTADGAERWSRVGDLLEADGAVSAGFSAAPLIDGQTGGLSALVGSPGRGDIAGLVAPDSDPAAGCRVVAVLLPPGARFKGYLYEVRDEIGSAGCVAGEICPLGDSLWPGHPMIDRLSIGTLVRATFANRATDRPRIGRLVVYFSTERR